MTSVSLCTEMFLCISRFMRYENWSSPPLVLQITCISFVFLCVSLYSTVHRSLSKIEIETLNFYRTVLEGYLELEARTGTVGKLQVSTFSFSECVFSKTRKFALKIDKTV